MGRRGSVRLPPNSSSHHVNGILERNRHLWEKEVLERYSSPTAGFGVSFVSTMKSAWKEKELLQALRIWHK